MGWNAERLEHWRGHYKKWERSGLTQKIYCEQEKLVLSTFERWAKRVRSNAQAQAPQKNGSITKTAKPLTLVPVRLSEERQLEHITLRSPSGWQLSMPATIDSQWLATLMRNMS